MPIAVLTLCITVLIWKRSSIVRSHNYAMCTVLQSEVHVKAVERKTEPVGQRVDSDASSAVAIVCGMDAATADRYEARNDALRSIARRRDLPEKNVAALIAYLHTADGAMRVERVAALKNDVMNLLRRQDPMPDGLVETLIAMFEGNNMGKNNFNSSGATAPDLENAAKFRGENKKVVFTSCFSCFQFYTFLHG